MAGAAKILVVDDRVEFAENIAEILNGEGYPTEVAISAEDALTCAQRGDVTVLITDFKLPGRTGADLVAALRALGSTIPAMVMSAHTDPDTIAASKTAGALWFFPKPIDFTRLLACVSTALASRS